MSLLCPNCREPLQNEPPTCRNGHTFGREDGVLVLLADDFAPRLQAYEAKLRALRAEAGYHRRLDAGAFVLLPFGPATRGDAAWEWEWRFRQMDLAVILSRIGAQRPQRVLDVGAWNNWLSHQLAARGHVVTAVDYFADEYDGLRARKFYPTVKWRAIQMDLAGLAALNETYDVVILNRCLQFFPDPAAYMEEARQRVAPSGQLIVTGMQFFRDTRLKRDSVAAFRSKLKCAGLDFLRPTKGYLDFDDYACLRTLGLKVRPYARLWLANLRARLRPTLPFHAYGVWR